MNSGIYLIQDDDTLVEMSESAYASEDLLQELLERYPNLLAGDQIDSAEPRRWLLIAREAGIPGEEGGGDRWAVDHLFLDQDGIPTLVEVKRSTDTRVRREVVGQMLGYAANAVVYWPLEKIQARFEASCRQQNHDSAAVLQQFLHENDPADFWQQVKTNLQAGRVRMLFVADDIPAELKRIVEFLNAQMDPAEVLAVEIKQFTGRQLKALVPRVHGQTEEARQKKSGGTTAGKQWTEQMFFAALDAQGQKQEATIAREILEWAKVHMPRIRWGKGSMVGSFIPVLDIENQNYQFFGVYPGDQPCLEVQFQWMSPPAIRTMEFRQAFLGKLNQIEGIQLPPDSINRRPNFPLKDLVAGNRLHKLLEVLNWAVEQCRAYHRV